MAPKAGPLAAQLLARLSADPKPDAERDLLVLAALGGPAALAEYLDDRAERPRPEPATAEAHPGREPMGAFLKAVTVEGFRGVGESQTLELPPGPGLTLVVGRNGSGKSSFAEALELLVTGDTYRWLHRAKVWQQGWRNLHHKTAAIEAEFLVEGAKGSTVVATRWKDDADLEVGHVIHRHGLDDETAFEVEAALIDAYPGLTNVVGGVGDLGAMHAKEIIARYCAEPAVFRHKALLISINRSLTEASPYDAVRYAWKINREKARQAEVILATLRGMIVGAFIAHDWLDATEENFPGREAVPGRLGFVGEEAPPAIAALYVGKRVPDEYRKPGASNPIKYAWD